MLFKRRIPRNIFIDKLNISAHSAATVGIKFRNYIHYVPLCAMYEGCMYLHRHANIITRRAYEVGSLLDIHNGPRVRNIVIISREYTINWNPLKSRSSKQPILVKYILKLFYRACQYDSNDLRSIRLLRKKLLSNKYRRWHNEQPFWNDTWLYGI